MVRMVLVLEEVYTVVLEELYVVAALVLTVDIDTEVATVVVVMEDAEAVVVVDETGDWAGR
jgi:hypothetical protein